MKLYPLVLQCMYKIFDKKQQHRIVLIFFQAKRLGALNKFKSKNRSILIATDVASRFVQLEKKQNILMRHIFIKNKY